MPHVGCHSSIQVTVKCIFTHVTNWPKAPLTSPIVLGDLLPFLPPLSRIIYGLTFMALWPAFVTRTAELKSVYFLFLFLPRPNFLSPTLFLASWHFLFSVGPKRKRWGTTPLIRPQGSLVTAAILPGSAYLSLCWQLSSQSIDKWNFYSVLSPMTDWTTSPGESSGRKKIRTRKNRGKKLGGKAV